PARAAFDARRLRSGAVAGDGSLDGRTGRIAVYDAQAHRDARVLGVRRLAHELGEVTLDPGARELVGHPDLEHVSVECERACGGAPGAEDHRREVVADA